MWDIASATPEELTKAGYDLDPGEELVPSRELDHMSLVRAMELKLPPEKYVLIGRRAESVRQGQSFGFLIE